MAAPRHGGAETLYADQVEGQEEHGPAQREIEQQGQQVHAAEDRRPKQGERRHGMSFTGFDQQESGQGRSPADKADDDGGIAPTPIRH